MTTLKYYPGIPPWSQSRTPDPETWRIFIDKLQVVIDQDMSHNQLHGDSRVVPSGTVFGTLLARTH